MPSYPSIPLAELEEICRLVADTNGNLKGSEIGQLLKQLDIHDPFPTMTKWKRLNEALVEKQRRDGCANCVIIFLLEVMKPVRFVGRSDVFESMRIDLNQRLIFVGYEIGQDGKLRECKVATTLSESEARAGRLKAELLKRNVHSDVFRFCRAELLQENYFHAVLETTKSLSEKIRSKTGLLTDGSELADKALALGATGMPFLAFNSLQTDSEKSEQKGLLNLMKGLFGTFRNTTAHAPKVSWNISEQDALDLLTMASFLHRRLDLAARTPRLE